MSIKSFKKNKHADKTRLQINEHVIEMIILEYFIKTNSLIVSIADQKSN